MNSKIKYSSIFLLLILLLILASGIAAAADIDGDNTEISDNIQTPTVADDAVSTPQTTDNNNNIETKTIKEVDDTYTDTTTTSEDNKLVKDDKNLKGTDYSCTLTLTPNTGAQGDTITAKLTGQSVFSGEHTINIYWDGSVIKTGTATASGWNAPVVTFEVPETTPGEHTVKYVSTLRNRNYIGTTTFTVEKTAEPTIMEDMNPVTGEIGNTIISITVHDANGNSITGSSNISIKDDEDNVLVEDYPIENGAATINVPTNKLGSYDLTVDFKGSRDYDPCSNTVTVTVSKAATTLIVDQDDEGLIYEIINVYENTLLTGTLVQTSNNKALANMPLKVTAGNEVYQTTTDEEGKFVFKYDVTEIVEDMPLTICFEGNDLYLASEVFEGSFDTESLEVNIALDEVTLSEVNETTTISGTITDNYDNQMPNAEVNIKINDEEPVTVTTDEEGKFSYDVVFTDAMEVTVDASMKNQEIYEAETASTSFTVVVGPKRNHLTIETGNGVGTNINIVDVTPYFDEVITNGTLIDIFGEPVADATIKILINGEDYSQTTDSEGKFTLVYNATEGLATYTLSVEFEGNDAYKPAEEAYTGTFKTEAFDITVTIDDNFPEEILIGDTVTVSGSATLQNQTLKNNQIVLTINGIRYTTTTDEEGRYSYDYLVIKYGTLPVKANATFNNANIKVGQTNMIVAHPVVNIDLDTVSDTTVLSEVPLNGRIYIAQNSTGIQTSLRFKINDNIIPLESDEEGYFTYTFTPEAIGEYNISISYPTEIYEVHNASTTINVAKRTTQLVSDKLPIAVRINDVFTISGTLIDQTGSGVGSAEVIFIINDEIFTNTTDENGHYEYNYQTTSVSENNLYEVRYSGDDNYALAKNYVGSFFDVELINPVITIGVEDATINMPTTIKGTVTDKANNPQANVDVKVTVNDEE
ncbi:MAG: Ig-like domain repeat protein, partial [Methanosphaera sp.]|nr:Ig-like domain repeat protein [Methanosphaera sp.]